MNYINYIKCMKYKDYKNILILIVYLYLICGIYFALFDLVLPKLYIGLLTFFTFKWIFNYRKCTISRVECLVRGVKKEKGYLFRFLNSIIDLRYEKEIILIITISILLILYNMIYKKHYIKILNYNI